MYFLYLCHQWFATPNLSQDICGIRLVMLVTQCDMPPTTDMPHCRQQLLSL